MTPQTDAILLNSTRVEWDENRLARRYAFFRRLRGRVRLDLLYYPYWLAPMLSDLRESGSLEQDADIVAFLYREDYYNPDTENKHTELIIAKHRNGPVDTVNLFFQKQFTKFVGFTKRES